MADPTWKQSYEEMRTLTQGGQGQILMVRRRSDGAELCLKRLINVANADRVARFRREVEISQSLSHPNLLPVIDASLDEAKPWYVSPYMSGGTLASRGASPVDEALRLIEQVLAGLMVLHERGVVHRDIKPENVFVDNDGRPVVGDLGLAFVLGDDPDLRLTDTTEAVGPRNYMAPELEDGVADQLSPAADVYSAGKLLYFLCAGRIFSREKHRDAGFNLLASDNTSRMHFVYELLDRSIAQDPAKRAADAGELHAWVRVQRNRLARGGRALNLSADLECSFCGLGHYRVIAGAGIGSSSDVNNFGYRPTGAPESIVLCCKVCGHAEYFRVDAAVASDVGWRRR